MCTAVDYVDSVLGLVVRGLFLGASAFSPFLQQGGVGCCTTGGVGILKSSGVSIQAFFRNSSKAVTFMEYC